MAQDSHDPWARWLLKRRHADDPEMLRRTLDHLVPIRDRVIAGARLAAGSTVLDVGCGDGLIAFAALGAVGTTGSVIFSDVSTELLERCAEHATEIGQIGRCRFVPATARDLSPIEDGSVDAVTMRSVLIYEADKAAAFSEFHRVLRPGGRLSLFEPINRFRAGSGLLSARDLGHVSHLAARVRAVYDEIQPADTDPMLDFDERDLIRLAETAGFINIHLQLNVEVEPREAMPWKTALNQAGNPRIPTLAEAMHQALSPNEIEQLSDVLRPRVENGHGQQRRAVTYLAAQRQ